MVAATHMQAIKDNVTELVSSAKAFFARAVAPLLPDEQALRLHLQYMLLIFPIST